MTLFRVRISLWSETFAVYARHFNLLEDVQAVDEETVTVRLLGPNSRFPVNVSGIWILPRHIFENVANPGSYFEPGAALGDAVLGRMRVGIHR
jgi:ABC-type transport system substrate-binding protein